MKKIIRGVIYLLSSFLFLALATAIIVVTSKQTVEWTAQRFAPQYGFGYEKISGGLFGGVKIEGLTYRDELLLKSAIIEFNPIALFYKKISIPYLEVMQVDVERIQKTIDAFATDSNDSKQSSSDFPFEIEIGKLKATLGPTEWGDIELRQASLTGSNIRYSNGKADAGSIELVADSNITALHQSGTIKQNRLTLSGSVSPKQALFDRYQIPFKTGALKDLAVAIEADHEKIKMVIFLEGKRVLGAKEKEFDIEEIKLDTELIYWVSKEKLSMTNEGNITIPYADKIRLSNSLNYQKEGLEYSGKVISGKIKGVDTNLTKPFDNMQIAYSGTSEQVNILLDSDGFQGRLDSADFKKGDLNISTKGAIQLGKLVSLPKEFASAWIEMDLRAPLHFADISSTQANLAVRSNLVNIDAKLINGKRQKIELKSTLPKESLLRSVSKELHLESMYPLTATLESDMDKLLLKLDSKVLQSNLQLSKKNKNINGDLIVAGTKYLFSGNIDKEFKLENRVGSLKDFMQKVSAIYTFEVPPLDGDMQLALKIKRLKDIELVLNSSELIYKADKKSSYILTNTAVSLGYSDQKLKLNHYHTTYEKQKIFATKPSEISLKDQEILISPLWINDELALTGVYDISKKKGELLANATPLTLSLEMVDCKSNLDLKGELDGERARIDGTITILDGELHYDLDQKRFATDSDIVIVQNIKKSNPNPYVDNLIVMVKVNTDKPLRYKMDGVDIKATADLLVEKAPHNPLQILGKAELLADSYYLFEEKKFVFKKSHINFTGDPSNPILDITALYKSIDYDITIQVTGNPQTPNIIFSSVPRLSREEILAVILFGSKESAGNNSGDDMMKMMGGAMAKSVLASAGIKIDYLSLGSDGNMEVGKRLSDKLTIIYVNDTVSGAKLQYDYSSNIKATISTDAESSGVDIIYKREFEEMK